MAREILQQIATIIPFNDALTRLIDFADPRTTKKLRKSLTEDEEFLWKTFQPSVALFSFCFSQTSKEI